MVDRGGALPRQHATWAGATHTPSRQKGVKDGGEVATAELRHGGGGSVVAVVVVGAVVGFMRTGARQYRLGDRGRVGGRAVNAEASKETVHTQKKQDATDGIRMCVHKGGTCRWRGVLAVTRLATMVMAKARYLLNIR